MIPKSGDWFSDKIMRRKKPVFMGRIYASRQAQEPPAIKHSTYSTPT
jgi:hypothetical protein